MFIDGVVADDSNTRWAQDQPNNWMNREDCVVINEKRSKPNTLNDVECAIKFTAICERSC